MTLEPIQPWPSEDEPSSNFLWLSLSYAEAAMVLCDALASDDFTRQYTSTRVIIYLCRHAAELYLKGAIAAKTHGQPPKTHRLEVLYATYSKLYASCEFHFDVPFQNEAMDFREGLFPGTLATFQASHDQRYRYPVDNAGKPFIESEAFDIPSYGGKIARFRQQLNGLVVRIEYAPKLGLQP
jgi:hypothetical protein